MLKKLNSWFTMLCIKGKSKTEELKNDVSGMEVIQVVILVAVGVILVGALIALIGPLLAEWWAAIQEGAGDPGGLAP